MPNVPVNANGFPMGGGQPQQPDPMPAFANSLQQSLNAKIGVPGQDTKPDEQAEFMLKNDPQGAVRMAQAVMQAVQKRMMQAMQAQGASMGQMPPQATQMAPQGIPPQTMPQGMPQGGQGGY